MLSAGPATRSPTTQGRARISNPFEIEHIWADKPGYYPTITRTKYAEFRHRFGALLLLPKDFNASFGDLPYVKKLPKYMGQNLLTQSLHPDCYQNNPSFLRVRDQYSLPFQPFADAFDPAAIDSRQGLYRSLCEVVWDPAKYGLQVPTSVPVRPKERSSTRITLRQLVDAQHLSPGSPLVGTHRGTQYAAELTAEGRIRLESGEEFDSPSPAAMAVLEKPSWNGWPFWQAVQQDGTLVKLDDLRKVAIECGLAE